MNERVYNSEIERLRSKDRLERLEVDKVIHECLQDNIGYVLDVGTGSGLFAEYFLRAGISVAAVDSSPSMVEVSRNFLPEIDIQLAQAEALPFRDNSFDVVFMGMVFHEVDNYKKALQEAFRVSLTGVYILEWEYIVQEFGPPLEHRLKSEFVLKLAEETGFKSTEVVRFSNLLLYKMKK